MHDYSHKSIEQTVGLNMLSRSKLIDDLKQIVGAEKVLTDAEDIYVYSFEHFFREKRYTNLIAVVRVSTETELRKVEEVAQDEGANVIRRSCWKPELRERETLSTVLIDDVSQPELEVIGKQIRKQYLFEFGKELEANGNGSFRDYAFALKSFYSSLPAQIYLNSDVSSGYCTVASSFNGIETWSSKGRTILTRALNSRDLQPSTKLINVLYTCSLCGLCFAQHFESTQIRKAIMQARHRIAEEKYVPELFAATAKNIFEFGDPSGMPPSKRVAWTKRLPQKGIFPKTADVLYWPGCVGPTRTPNVTTALGNILTRANANFTLLGKKEGCCGYVLLAAGLWDDARENAKRLIQRVKQIKAETLVTPCSGCYYTFKKLYPEIIQVELPCQVLHSTQFVERLIEEKRIMPHSLDWKITYHDPCSLGRHCNVYDSPRKVLKAVPNLEFVEMSLNRDRSRCCGAGGGLWSFNNNVAMAAATEKLVKDVAPIGVSALATACPTCHMNFKYASAKKSMGIKIYDVMEVIEAALEPQNAV
jgi:heterodisulfide reductase subunit D